MTTLPLSAVGVEAAVHEWASWPGRLAAEGRPTAVGTRTVNAAVPAQTAVVVVAGRCGSGCLRVMRSLPVAGPGIVDWSAV